jgi:hypothetical protein
MKPRRPHPYRANVITSFWSGEAIGWSVYPDQLPAMQRRAALAVDMVLALRVPVLRAAAHRPELAAHCVSVAFRAVGLDERSLTSRRAGSLRAAPTPGTKQATPPPAGKTSSRRRRCA